MNAQLVENAGRSSADASGRARPNRPLGAEGRRTGGVQSSVRTLGDRLDAHDLLAPLCCWFTEGFDSRDLKDAGALLEQLANHADFAPRRMTDAARTPIDYATPSGGKRADTVTGRARHQRRVLTEMCCAGD